CPPPSTNTRTALPQHKHNPTNMTGTSLLHSKIRILRSRFSCPNSTIWRPSHTQLVRHRCIQAYNRALALSRSGSSVTFPKNGHSYRPPSGNQRLVGVFSRCSRRLRCPLRCELSSCASGLSSIERGRPEKRHTQENKSPLIR